VPEVGVVGVFNSPLLSGDVTPLISDAARHVYRAAFGTPATSTGVDRIDGPDAEPTGGDVFANEEPVSRAFAPHVAAVEDLRAWLGVSYDAIAAIAGVQRSVISWWRTQARSGRDVRPRATTVRQLYRAHAIVRSVLMALEEEPGAGAVQAWAVAGETNRRPIDFLMSGDIEAVESLAASLMSTPARERAHWRPLLTPEVSRSEPALLRFDPDDFEDATEIE
jgi:hypothetical protein